MPKATSSLQLQYRIDYADHIRFINEAWLQFACENAGEHLNRAHVIGKSLWSFIEGEDVKQIYGLIFKKVRTQQQSAVFRFRCDSPVCRRYFLLTVSPLDEGELVLMTHPLREVPRAAISLLDPDVQRGEQCLTICSWCTKACLPPKDWVELEEVIARLDLLDGGDIPRLTHGICLQCQGVIENELKNLE